VGEFRPPHWKVFGKPNPEPYKLADAVLAEQAHRLGLTAPESIYMVGGEAMTEFVPLYTPQFKNRLPLIFASPMSCVGASAHPLHPSWG